MTELRVGEQLIHFDREATIAAYSGISQGDADRCTCSGCRNFAIQRSSVYPCEFRELLTTAGVDPVKEGEAVHYGSKDNVHFYDGWFYFVGEVVNKGESCVSLGEGFKYFIGTGFPQPPKAFGRPVIILLPWLLEEPYDPNEDRQIRIVKDIMRRYSGALRKLANTEIDDLVFDIAHQIPLD